MCVLLWRGYGQVLAGRVGRTETVCTEELDRQRGDLVVEEAVRRVHVADARNRVWRPQNDLVMFVLGTPWPGLRSPPPCPPGSPW